MGTSAVKEELDPILSTFDKNDSISDEEAEALVEEKMKKYKDPVVNFKEEIDVETTDGLINDFKEARRVLADTIDRAKKISDTAFESMAVKNGDPVLLGIAGDSNKTVQASVKSLMDLHFSVQKVISQRIRNRKEEEEPSEKEEKDGSEMFAKVGGNPTVEK